MANIYTKEELKNIKLNENVVVGESESSDLICIVSKNEIEEILIKERAFMKVRKEHEENIMSFAQLFQSGFAKELEEVEDDEPLNEEEKMIQDKISNMKLFVKASNSEKFIIPDINMTVIIAFNKMDLHKEICKGELVVASKGRFVLTMM